MGRSGNNRSLCEPADIEMKEQKRLPKFGLCDLFVRHLRHPWMKQRIDPQIKQMTN